MPTCASYRGCRRRRLPVVGRPVYRLGDPSVIPCTAGRAAGGEPGMRLEPVGLSAVVSASEAGNTPYRPHLRTGAPFTAWCTAEGNTALVAGPMVAAATYVVEAAAVLKPDGGVRGGPRPR